MRQILFLLAATSAALAQNQSRFGADFAKEGSDFHDSCIEFSIGGCADLLFTGQPLHIAVGSLSPLDGFGGGPAFVYHWTPNESWRISLDADGIVSNNLSWRAGVYVTAAYTRRKTIGVTTGGGSNLPQPTQSGAPEVPVIHAYVQTESLKTLGFFGIGPSTSDTARTFYGMRETIAGGDLTYPLRPGIALFGEANARAVALRADPNQSSPSIEENFTNATAPGLASQPTFAQLGEGLRLTPNFANGRVGLNYAFTLRHYLPGDGSSYAFHRFTVDLNHQFSIYKSAVSLAPLPANGPDDCVIDASSKDTNHCPPIVTKNKEGTIGLRLWMVDSLTSGSNLVPFFFQPTLGGSDIDGNMALPSYQNYRFRAPNAMLVRATFEHSIWGPFGVSFLFDAGKVAGQPSQLDFTHMLHSYAAGINLRAGGFPMVYLMFAWGGHEGTHTIFNLNTSLLGGAARPSLY